MHVYAYLYGGIVVFLVENCNRMLSANGVHWLCSRLMDYDPSRQLLFRSVDILWNVLQKCTSRDQLSTQLNDIRCVRYCVVVSSAKYFFLITSLSTWSKNHARSTVNRLWSGSSNLQVYSLKRPEISNLHGQQSCHLTSGFAYSSKNLWSNSCKYFGFWI